MPESIDPGSESPCHGFFIAEQMYPTSSMSAWLGVMLATPVKQGVAKSTLQAAPSAFPIAFDTPTPALEKGIIPSGTSPSSTLLRLVRVTTEPNSSLAHAGVNQGWFH